jgi:hypothetical protein
MAQNFAQGKQDDSTSSNMRLAGRFIRNEAAAAMSDAAKLRDQAYEQTEGFGALRARNLHDQKALGGLKPVPFLWSGAWNAYPPGFAMVSVTDILCRMRHDAGYCCELCSSRIISIRLALTRKITTNGVLLITSSRVPRLRPMRPKPGCSINWSTGVLIKSPCVMAAKGLSWAM